MTDSHKLRFGMIGAGAIAQAYARSFQDCAHAQLVGVADVRPEAAKAVAEASGCAAFSSHQDLVRHGRPDAVVVCTPPVTHEPICLDLLGGGVNVLCEKPLTLSHQSAVKLIAAAERAGVLFTMASKFRYAADVVQAKSIVASGALGEVILFENSFTGRVDMSARWNSNPDISGGGVLIDNGTHSVDIMRYFLGPIESLRVTEGRRIQDLPVEDTVQMSIRSQRGAMGNIDLSWSISKELPTYLSLYGSLGTLHVGWRESRYKVGASGAWQSFGTGYDKHQAFSAQLDNFAQAVRGREELRITPEDALASVDVIEAAYAALRDSRWRSVGGDAATTPCAHPAPASSAS